MPNNPLFIQRLKKNDPTLTKITSRPGEKVSIRDIGEIVEAAKNNPYIKTLTFWENGLGDPEVALLAQLSSVEELQLNDNVSITDKSINMVVKMPKLKKLELAGNSVTDAGAKILAESSLVYLNIDRNDITDAGAAHFLQNTTLRELFLKGEGVSDRQVAEVEKYIEENNKKLDVSLSTTQNSPGSKITTFYANPNFSKEPEKKTIATDQELPVEVAESLSGCLKTISNNPQCAESLSDFLKTILNNPQCREKAIELFLNRAGQMPAQAPTSVGFR